MTSKTHDDEPGRNQGIRSHKKSPKPKEGLPDEKKGHKMTTAEVVKTGNEPEVQPPVKHKGLSKAREAVEMRRKIIVDALINGENLTDATIKAGYSEKTATAQGCGILKQDETKKLFSDILDREGVTDEFLAKKIRTLLDAREIKYFQTKGIVTDEREVEALETQRKTAELAAKLKGHLKDRSELDINVGIMAMVVAAVGQIGPGNEGEDGEG